MSNRTRQLPGLDWLTATIAADTDAELLQRFSECRDEVAFAALVARHGPMVFRTCRRLLEDQHEAEDAFQATFLILARRASAIGQSSVAGWLHAVAHRVTANARRAARRRPRTSSDVIESYSLAPETLSEVVSREMLALLEQEIRRLPDTYRLPIVLCCLEGLSQDEVARQLACTPGAVRGRLERGRALLHSRLSRSGFSLAGLLAALGSVRGESVIAPSTAAATARAAVEFAAGRVVSTGLLSTTAITLANGGLQVFNAKRWLVLAVVLFGATMFVSAGMFDGRSGGRAPAQATALAPDAASADSSRVIHAVGDWSEEVDSLRGRLLLSQGRVLGDGKTRETRVYVELEYANHRPANLYFDPNQLKCELHDAAGKAVAQHPIPGSGGRPGASWAELPFDSAVRLRVNPFAFGRADDVGLLIPLNNASWLIKAGDTGSYFLSGTLTVTPPEGHGKAGGWKGVLKLPKMKLSLSTGTARRTEVLPALEPTQQPKAVEWSEKKDGLVARLRLVRDDELHGFRVLLEVNNYSGLGGGIAFPGTPKVELSVLDAEGKALKTSPALVSILRPADPADAVISGTSCAVFRVDHVYGKTGRAGYLLFVNEAWELEPGKQYTIKGKLVSKARDPKGWAGPLDLPPVTVTLPPASTR